MSGRLYEGMFLLDANETARDWSALENHIQQLLTKHQAHVEYSERWPDQRLAYDVKGVRKGTYYLTYFRAPPETISDLRRDVELSEQILRFLVIREDWLEAEMQRRQEAAARRAQQPPEAHHGERPAAAPPEAVVERFEDAPEGMSGYDLEDAEDES